MSRVRNCLIYITSLQLSNSINRDNREVADFLLRQTERGGAPKTGLLRLCTREWNEIDRCKRIDRSSVDRRGAPYKITRSSWLRSALAGVSSSCRASRTWSYLNNVTWKSNTYLLGQRVGKRAACTKKLNHSPETTGDASKKRVAQSPKYIRELSFVLSSLRSERTKRFSSGDETERDRST